MSAQQNATKLERGTLTPAARLTDMVISEVAEEVIAYDRLNHHIHHLNKTSAVIWRLCDGTRTDAELARLAGNELDADVDEATIRAALNQLSNAGLLERPLPTTANGTVQSRRKLLRRVVVVGALAAPAVVSMTAPRAASASSASCSNQNCTADNPGAACGCLPPICQYSNGTCSSVGVCSGCT